MTTKHVFGGEHTEKKLDIIEAYIEVYSKILSRTYFQIFYIDAFAGTGFRNEETYLPLFNKNEKKRILPGSAIRALNANFDFDKYFFIEKNKKYFTSLKNTCNDYPHKTTICINGEANEQIEKLCREINWKKLEQLYSSTPTEWKLNLRL